MLAFTTFCEHSIWFLCRVAAMIRQLPIPFKDVTMGHRHTEISTSLAMAIVSYVGTSCM